MRFISFKTGDHTSWGTISGSQIRDLGTVNDTACAGLTEVIGSGALESVLAAAGTAPLLDLESVTLLSPISESTKIICVGLNYADHIAEMNRPTPEKPVIFTRFPDSLVGSEQPLRAPRESEQFDYEGEFCIVIGREGRRISAESALDHVFGYTIMNDGSIRDYQRHTHQFTPGKNFPESGALGPEIVTRDEFGAVSSQRIMTRINGHTVQNSSLDQLVFSVPELVAYCSEWTTLRPGDIIATGTPGGVGDGYDPKLWLAPGDTVEVEVEGIGTLRNTVISD